MFLSVALAFNMRGGYQANLSHCASQKAELCRPFCFHFPLKIITAHLLHFLYSQRLYISVVSSLLFTSEEIIQYLMTYRPSGIS